MLINRSQRIDIQVKELLPINSMIRLMMRRTSQVLLLRRMGEVKRELMRMKKKEILKIKLKKINLKLWDI